jgi:hypothetical protein
VTYPFEIGGADDYPVKVGSMLLTMVDPNKGFERAYNRWYERDHYYAGCMVGPWQLAGSRWVAPRSLKDLRWPAGEETIASPTDAGSYVAIYWIEAGHHEEWNQWGQEQVAWLYSNGRGFSERKHTHTVLYDHVAADYRDEDPVPMLVALDAAYDGIVLVWFDGRDGLEAPALLDRLRAEALPALLGGSSIEIVGSFRPNANPAKDQPMDLGTPAGGPGRLCQMLFVRGDVTETLGRVRAYTDAVEAAGLADLRLAAPFLRTDVGRDTHVDELW